MKLTIRQLLDSVQAIQELANDKNIPFKYSMKLAKVLRTFKKEIELYDEKRIELLKTCATENGEKYDFNSPEDEKGFLKTLNEYFEEEIEIHGDKIREVHFKDTKISPASLVQLEWLIEEEPETQLTTE